MIKKNIYLLIVVIGLTSFVRSDKEFKVFQFPQNQIPRIDGDFSDWDIIPDSYIVGLDELINTGFGEGIEQDSNDFDLKVKVGWVKGLKRLYFYIEAYDDFWDFSDLGLRQDIFELVIDGDASGGTFINQENWNFKNRSEDQLFFNGSGTHAQNYHVFVPAKDKDWAMSWGNFPWTKEFPYANAAYNYNFKQGESGILQMEFYITPYDYAAFKGPEHSVETELKENKRIGISWSMLDFDGNQCESFMNLSHDFQMINNASYLCKFLLMPLENEFINAMKADWKFTVDHRKKWKIHFQDYSVENITKWHWDFGDGQTSKEQHPTHIYKSSGAWEVILTVEGPEGKSVRAKVWDVVTQ